MTYDFFSYLKEVQEINDLPAELWQLMWLDDKCQDSSILYLSSSNSLRLIETWLKKKTLKTNKKKTKHLIGLWCLLPTAFCTLCHRFDNKFAWSPDLPITDQSIGASLILGNVFINVHFNPRQWLTTHFDPREFYFSRISFWSYLFDCIDTVKLKGPQEVTCAVTWSKPSINAAFYLNLNYICESKRKKLFKIVCVFK